MSSVPSGLDFARRILKKYGWTEGKGLGVREDGIAKAIKPALKLNRGGVGHEGESVQFTSRWWECAYNEAAEAIAVVSSEDGIQVKKKNKNKPKNKHALPPEKMYETVSYNSFVKTSFLLNGETMLITDKSECVEVKNEMEPTPIHALTDEEIFQACGKRTVHKGARHGLKLSGKLARLARQEEELFERLQRVADQPGSKNEENLPDRSEKVLNDLNVHSCTKNKKKKKKKIIKYPVDSDILNNLSLNLEASSSQGDLKNKRKKKKEYPSSDLITEIEVPIGEIQGHKRKKPFPNEDNSVMQGRHYQGKNCGGSMEYSAHKGSKREAEEHSPAKKKKELFGKLTD